MGKAFFIIFSSFFSLADCKTPGGREAHNLRRGPRGLRDVQDQRGKPEEHRTLYQPLQENVSYRHLKTILGIMD